MKRYNAFFMINHATIFSDLEAFFCILFDTGENKQDKLNLVYI